MSKLKSIKHKTCRMCDSSKFYDVINIGEHPLVNSLISKNLNLRSCFSNKGETM